METAKLMCTKCGKEERYKCNLHGKPFVTQWCKVCHNAYARARRHSKPYDAEKHRYRNLWNNHGITKEEYNLMFFQQGGYCAICGQQETKIHPVTGKVWPLSVDHNHETGQIRGLLCNYCNHILGFVEKDRGRARKILKYLKKYDR